MIKSEKYNENLFDLNNNKQLILTYNNSIVNPNSYLSTTQSMTSFIMPIDNS